MSPRGSFLMAQPQIPSFCLLRQHGSDATTTICLALGTIIHLKVYNLQPSCQHQDPWQWEGGLDRNPYILGSFLTKMLVQKSLHSGRNSENVGSNFPTKWGRWDDDR